MNPFTTELLSKISSIIVKKFIRSGNVSPEDYQDMTQTLCTKYLAKKDHIESLYKGDAQPQTYMSSVLRMMMLEELRQINRTHIPTEGIDDVGYKIDRPDGAISAEQKLIIENEKKHFDRVLRTMGKDSAKINLCLKMSYRIKISQQDWQCYLNGRDSHGAEQYLQFSDQEHNKDINARLCQITNLVEQADNKPDAIRIWLSSKLDQLLKRMNMNRQSKYDSESLGILLELMNSRIGE